ncbi:hypothetical protein V1527DRAFT_475774 [Lipomyces starkeyi]
MKKVNHQEEPGSRYECSCKTLHRYLLPCAHRIEMDVPLDVQDIHPRWRVTRNSLP